jgi:hypothetical protein
MSIKDRQAQALAQQTAAQNARQDLVTPEGDVNKPLLAAKQQIAGAGAARTLVNVNSFTPASEEAQKDFMKGIRARYDQLQSAPVALNNIEKAKELLPTAKLFMGPKGEGKLEIVKFFNNNLGTNLAPESVKSAEELRSRLFSLTMDNLKKMDAQPSQYQQQVMQEAFGTLGTDPTAAGRVLDVYGQALRDRVAIHNQEVEGSVANGVRFPYDPTIKLKPPTKVEASVTANVIQTATNPKTGEKLMLKDGQWVPYKP